MMSELCLSTSTPSKTTKFSSLVLSDLFLFCSFVFSHPLYFSYLLFFSPYLLRVLSFLSPLFITTSLLLLALLTTLSPRLLQDLPALQGVLNDGRVRLLFAAYCSVKQSLHSKPECDGDDGIRSLEEFEAYNLVFDTSLFDVRENENPVEVMELESGDICSQDLDAPFLDCSSDEGSWSETASANFKENSRNWRDMEEQRLDNFFRGLGEYESRDTGNVEAKKIEPMGEKPDKVVEVQNGQLMARSGSEAEGNKKFQTPTVEVNDESGRDQSSKVTVHSQTSGDCEEEESKIESANLGSYGSMRKEKEWKRTLACKLFEERHNVDGSEGMDLLWETYEMDSVKAKQQEISATKKKSNKSKNKKKSKAECYEKGEKFDEYEDEDEGEVDGQLCCLQALKFSAGKMNLGMGSSKLVKISKAFKGIGWLHKHSKKVYNGDRF